MHLDDVLSRLKGMPAKELAELQKEVEEQTRGMAWVPNPGPQTEAYFSEADETLYGGEAGGGKTDLLIGLAITQHKRSLIMRRINEDATTMGDRLVEILGTDTGYTRKPPTWRRGRHQQIELRGCEQEKDKQRFKGRPHDLKAFDELADFLESQYEFIIGWNRTTDPKQRCRVVAATNPPTTAEGQWIVRRWAAWLDPNHPKPAKSGEIRWYLKVNGVETEVDGSGPHKVPGRPKPIRATSRTFIRSGLKDNPDLDHDGQYEARLEALPEELRRAYREGDFAVGQKDGDFQVIPTAWIIAAQNRWKESGHVGVHMTAMALDPAGGGQDAAEIACRYGGWFAPLETVKGPDTADGSSMAARVLKSRRNNCPVVVDVGGGYGGSVTMRMKDNGVSHVAFNGANTSGETTRDGKLRFANRRAEAWWRFREELDPDQEGGSVIALPPGAELRADLAAPTWSLTAQGILVEPKRSVGKDGKINGGIVKRLGRSPGKGDAVVMCLSEGSKAVMRQHAVSAIEREKYGFASGHAPRVVMSRNRGHRR